MSRLRAVRSTVAEIADAFHAEPALGLFVPDQLRHRELAGPVDADEQVELAFGGLHFGDVEVEEPIG